MSTSRRNAPYHHGDLRQALLEAGLRLLEQAGEPALTLREIARLVGVSPAAPYRHFANHAALLEALAVTGFQRFTRHMTEVRAAAQGALPAMGEAYVAFALEQPNLFRLMFSPRLSRDGLPGLRMAADAAYQTLGALVEGDRLQALAYWARVHGLAILLLDGQVRLGSGEDVAALVREVLARR